MLLFVIQLSQGPYARGK